MAKKEVLVFIFDGYADWESAFVCAELNAASDYQVKTISLDKTPKTSMGGFRVTPDYSVDAFPEDFSMLILPGGMAWLGQGNDAVAPLVAHAVRNHIPVGAICNAVHFMAENGYLDKIRHTGNTMAYLQSTAPHYRGGENFLEEQAVCDHNIITANGSAALEFAVKIFSVLGVKDEQALGEWYAMHKKGYYKAAL